MIQLSEVEFCPHREETVPKDSSPLNHRDFLATPGKKIKLKDYDPGFTNHYKNKEEAALKLCKDVKRLAKYAEMKPESPPADKKFYASQDFVLRFFYLDTGEVIEFVSK